MKSAHFALMFGTILYAGNVLASNCVQMPDCQSLGFTKTESECSGRPTVFCPTDKSKAFCVIKASLPILYGDGTVSKEYPLDGKTPIGIVFDESKRLAMALTIVSTSKGCWNGSRYTLCSEMWTGVYRYEDVSPDFFSDSEVENCEYPHECKCDGRKNTTLLLNTEKNPHIPVDLVNNYEPDGCSANFCKKTNWFLPCLNSLSSIFDARKNIDQTLTLLGKDELERFYYWSSEEISNLYMLTFTFNEASSQINGCITSDKGKTCYIRTSQGAKYNASANVLPVVKY